MHMKKLLLKNKVFLLLMIILAFILISLFLPFQTSLVFEKGQTGKVMAFIPLKETKEFGLRYTHSIHLTDVLESYKATKNESIQLYELMYEDFGVGMPSDAAEGEIFQVRDGKYYLKNMKRILPYFDLRVGQVKANHKVIYNGHPYTLSQFIEPGSKARVKIKKLTIMQQLRGVNILEQS